MAEYIPDTNALISFLTDRDPRQQIKISPYFEEAFSGGSVIVITEIVTSEFVYVLENVYGIDSREVSAILARLAKSPGVRSAHFFDLERVLELWPHAIPDYGDAVLGCYALALNTPVVTFDRKLARRMKRKAIPCVML